MTWTTSTRIADMHETDPSADPAPSTLSRRRFLTLAVGGAGGMLMAGAPLTTPAATASPTPPLPGEFFRKGNQATAKGTLYDNICVRINGDVARVFVPQTVKPNSGVPVPVVWFYHGAGSDHSALEAGFKNHSQAVVDRGLIAICQTAGGSVYSHPTAVALQVAGWQYMSNVFTISHNVLRSTSGGGALAVETYARDLIPRIAGMYNVNATYDIRAHYDQGGDPRLAIVAAFGENPAAIDAANPARHPASAWSGKRLRVCVSQPNETDLIVPPEQHGLRLRSLALPVAAEASVQTHANGHSTPAVALSDFLTSMLRWGVFDTQAPAVSIVSPANGATVKGTVTASITAADNVAVTDVGLYLGTRRIATAKPTTGAQWAITFNTKSASSPNGTYSLTAKATDSSGNVGTSPPISVRIAN